jgi:hypothetical protein
MVIKYLTNKYVKNFKAEETRKVFYGPNWATPTIIKVKSS